MENKTKYKFLKYYGIDNWWSMRQEEGTISNRLDMFINDDGVSIYPTFYMAQGDRSNGE